MALTFISHSQSCCRRRQLYITTISEEGEEASPDSGKLFVVDVQRAQGAGGAHKYVGPV